MLQRETDQDKLLTTALSWQYRPVSRLAKAGDVAGQYMDNRARSLTKNTAIVDTWNETLPVGLREHCRLAEVKNGVLEVEVEPGVYMHELRLVSSELLEEIRSRCGRAAVKKIKLCPTELIGGFNNL